MGHLRKRYVPRALYGNLGYNTLRRTAIDAGFTKNTTR